MQNRKIVNVIFFILLAIFNVNFSKAFAGDLLVDKEGAAHFFEIYQNEDHWILDTYVAEPGQLQDKLQTLRFETENEARKKFRVFQSSILKSNPRQPAYKYLTTEVDEKLWRVTKDWDANWDVEFHKWVAANISEDFFANYGIATDCADVAIVLRWIFARENQLPAANHLEGSGVLFTQDSFRKAWLSLPTAKNWYEDKRFLAAIEYVMDNSSTRTLPADSYPVALKKETILPGTILLEAGTHTRVVSETNYNDESKVPIRLLSSTTPKAVRSLHEEVFWNVWISKDTRSGLRMMRWPARNTKNAWALVPAESHPNYSDEQHSDEFLGKNEPFSNVVIEALGIELNTEAILKATIDELVEYINLRKDVVEQGFEFCKTNDCAPGGKNFEDWSTTSRDKRLASKIQSVENLISELAGYGEERKHLIESWELKKRNTKWVLAGREQSLAELILLASSSFLSDDPRQSLEHRWASVPTAVASNVARLVTATLEKRDAKIGRGRGAACEKWCSPGSEEYLAKTTQNEDLTLTRSLYGVFAYCEKILPESCTQLKTNLRDRNLDLLGQKTTLEDFLNEKVVWLNSNPNATYAVRWGKNGEGKSHFLFDSDFSFQISKAGFYVSGRGGILQDTAGQIYLAPVSGAALLNKFSIEFPFFIYSKDPARPGLYVFEAQSKSWRHIAVQGAGIQSDIYWMGSRHFAVADAGKIQLHKLNHFGKAEPIGAWERWHVPDSRAGYLVLPDYNQIIVSENGKNYLLYEKSQEIVKLETLSEIDLSQIDDSILVGKESILIITNTGLHYAVKIADGLVRKIDVPANFHFLDVAPDFGVLVGEHRGSADENGFGRIFLGLDTNLKIQITLTYPNGRHDLFYNNEKGITVLEFQAEDADGSLGENSLIFLAKNGHFTEHKSPGSVVGADSEHLLIGPSDEDISWTSTLVLQDLFNGSKLNLPAGAYFDFCTWQSAFACGYNMTGKLYSISPISNGELQVSLFVKKDLFAGAQAPYFTSSYFSSGLNYFDFGTKRVDVERGAVVPIYKSLSVWVE